MGSVCVHLPFPLLCPRTTFPSIPLVWSWGGFHADPCSSCAVMPQTAAQMCASVCGMRHGSVQFWDDYSPHCSPNLPPDMMAWHIDASWHIDNQGVISGHLFFIPENILCTLLGYTITRWIENWLDIALKPQIPLGS